MNTAQKALRNARLFHVALLASAISQIALPRLIDFGAKRQFTPLFPLMLGATSVVILSVAIFFRKSRMAPAEEVLQRNPEDSAAALRWRGSVVVSLVLCESIVLYGLLLRILGVPWAISGVFYAVGIFFMLAWWPRLELPTS